MHDRERPELFSRRKGWAIMLATSFGLWVAIIAMILAIRALLDI